MPPLAMTTETTAAAANAGLSMTTGNTNRVDVVLKLAQLQNLCKRDPEGYREDYLAQARRLESELGILALQPSSEPSAQLLELIQFVAAVASSSYKGKESDRVVNLLISMLLGSPSLVVSGDTNESNSNGSDVQKLSSIPPAALTLHRDVRKTCVSALILMRNKGVVPPLRLLELFFRLLAVIPDKALREQLYKHLVNDIRNINKKKYETAVNRSIQAFLHRVVNTHGNAQDSDEIATNIAARKATDLVCELYRRRVWTDDRAVAIVASAIQSPNVGTMCKALRFFLNIEEKMAHDEKVKNEEETQEACKVNQHLHSKKTAARKRETEKQMKKRKKVLQKKESDYMETRVENDKGIEASKKLYPAIELLHDPQGLAEYSLKRLKSVGQFKYEVKLLLMNFVTRLVGNHELMLLPLYSFLQKYMGGAQRDVTAVLAYTVQACHEYVPPDEVYGILKTIAHNFITERCSEEQMAVGINAVRAICARVPSVMSVEESDATATNSATVMDIEAFTRDIAAFANHRDRSVSIAGKAWTNFVRDVNPGLLQGKHRGLKGSALHKGGVRPMRYGEQKVAAGVEGADLLAEYEAKKAAQGTIEDPENPIEEDESSDDDDVSGEWQDVEDDDEQDGEVGENQSDNDEGGSDLGENVDTFEGDFVSLDVDDGGDSEDDDNESDSDDEAPNLVKLDKNGDAKGGTKLNVDVSKMSQAERDKLKQQVSSSRIFSASDFAKMRKLVEREQKLKSDPREAARRKRAIARGQDFEELSEDESSDSDSEDEQMRVSGVVNPSMLMAESLRKKQSKAERLQSIIAGRTAFESKKREGGSTNIEKTRKKNFLMTKNSRTARDKNNKKPELTVKRKTVGKHQAKKRRRKM